MSLYSIEIYASLEDNKLCNYSGIVVDADMHKPLPFASIKLFNSEKYLRAKNSDVNGFFELNNLVKGNYVLKIEYIGYKPIELKIELVGDVFKTIKLSQLALELNEITVTSTESKGLTGTTIIGKRAMQHLQPSSFTDLLSLLPGGMTNIPSLGSANVVKLREVGILSGQYFTSSMGTKFVVDDVGLNESANLQYIPQAYQYDEDSYRNHVNYGVDMRSINTDNIEKVEVIRGIPSVRYGNLTTGLVNITRKMKESPLETRFKADGYSKLFYVGKGIALGNQKNLNVDFGLLKARIDPRNPFENYDRLNSSIRYRQILDFTNGASLIYNTNFDYTGTLDKVKEDPQVLYNLEDTYKTYYNKFRYSNKLKYLFEKSHFLKDLSLNHSLSFSIDKIKQTELTQVFRSNAITNLEQDGESDGIFLPEKYIANYKVDGRPFYSNLRIEVTASMTPIFFKHDFILGGQWDYTKNFGKGQVYDPMKPLKGNSSRRPRAYKDIPGTNIFALYFQDLMTADIGKNTLVISAGIRASSLRGLSSKFELHNYVNLDPRLNIRWNFPKVFGVTPWLGLGVGRVSIMPNISQLYPQKIYYDIAQLYYWNANPDLRRINYRTYILNANNYKVKAAHNNKFEARLGFDSGKHHFSVTYFYENMKDGFRYITNVRPFEYKKYDRKAIDGSILTGPPELENVPYVMDTVLRSYSSMGNGSRIMKKGLEFQYSSPVLPYIKTRITINGAWFHSIYENSYPEFYPYIDKVIGDVVISDRYVGLYDWKDSYTKKRLSAKMIMDTYISKLGLVFSTSAESVIKDRMFIPRTGTIPTHYMDIKGELHEYTKKCENDIYLQWLNLSGGKGFDQHRKSKYYILFNCKLTKRIGKNSRLSFFANRFAYIAPNYNKGNVVIRRNFNPYFGTELNINF